MLRPSFFFVALLSLIFLTSTAPAQERLVIEGTGDSQNLLRQLARAFEAAHPGTEVIVPDSIGSSGGIKALMAGQCDLARVARPLKEKEKAQASDLSYREFALSPVVFAANLPGRCLDNLTTEQVAGIFSGSLRDWSELGDCTSHKIYVAMRETGDSSRSVLESRIPEFKAIREFAGKVIYSTPEAAQILRDYPFTIGFLPLSQSPPELVTLTYNGVPPQEANVRSGAYPLVSPFGLVWKGELAGPGARFVDFIFSPEGAGIIRDAGVIPTAR